jgi:thiamine-phosphate diphosphorylase
VTVPVIHAITDDEVLLGDDFLPRAREVMEALGPRGAVHLRARTVTTKRLCELADWLLGWERDSGCWLVVNDRVDVARACGVTAVQLTARSMSPADARHVAPDLRIGVSVHSAAAAREAERAEANWCVAGPVFPTATHPGNPGGGAQFIREVAAATGLPVVAIGGVTPEHVGELRQAGAHGVAAIRGIWTNADVGAAARRYLSSYDEHEGRS